LGGLTAVVAVAICGKIAGMGIAVGGASIAIGYKMMKDADGRVKVNVTVRKKGVDSYRQGGKKRG
jgi:hypothetical protein